MTTVKEQIDFMWRGGMTRRFHTFPAHIGDTVGEHSYLTACLTYLMGGEAIKGRVIMAALTHDMAEHIMGDIPAPTKRAFSDIADFGVHEESLLDDNGWGFPLSKPEKRLVKLADIYASILTCVKEAATGNKFLTPVMLKFIDYALELNPTHIEREVLDRIMELYAELVGEVISYG
jgi:5'-deoxynucleotidase YfbR-like HD superfamily hydrolase